jgi:hypothetical protein
LGQLDFILLGLTGFAAIANTCSFSFDTSSIFPVLLTIKSGLIAYELGTTSVFSSQISGNE